MIQNSGLALNSLLNEPRWLPYYGWHDDHREQDGTEFYRPAIMQVRSEFLDFVSLLRSNGVIPQVGIGRTLQLGLGNCGASHAMWRSLMGSAFTIDRNGCSLDDELLLGADTHSREASIFAANNGPYDLLFIDAGHTFDDVAADYADYAPLVRPGGIIAFHDALPRAAYPEVEVHKFLARRLPEANIIGTEVGIAWIHA